MVRSTSLSELGFENYKWMALGVMICSFERGRDGKARGEIKDEAGSEVEI